MKEKNIKERNKLTNTKGIFPFVHLLCIYLFTYLQKKN